MQSDRPNPIQMEQMHCCDARCDSMPHQQQSHASMGQLLPVNVGIGSPQQQQGKIFLRPETNAWRQQKNPILYVSSAGIYITNQVKELIR